MSKVLQILLKYLGVPILQELGLGLVQYIRDYFRKRKIKKDQKAKEDAVKNAKTPDEIRAAHRRNKL